MIVIFKITNGPRLIEDFTRIIYDEKENVIGFYSNLDPVSPFEQSQGNDGLYIDQTTYSKYKIEIDNGVYTRQYCSSPKEIYELIEIGITNKVSSITIYLERKESD